MHAAPRTGADVPDEDEVALVILGIVVGAWMWLAQPNLLGSGKAPGAKSTNKGAPTDPNDPRSRKADRLPGPS